MSRGLKPFFLYLSLTGPHTPISPSPPFVGKSGIGAYGDYVLEIDATVGKIVAALRGSRRLDDTILIFASDNGSPARIDNASAAGSLLSRHRSNGPARGLKAGSYEGGFRVPLIVSWPNGGVIGRTTRTVSLIDLPSTLADLIGHPLQSAQSAPESVSFADEIVPELRPSRPSLRGRGHYGQSLSGNDTLRYKCWKLIERPFQLPELNYACNPIDQEMTNFAKQQPLRLNQMQRLLDAHLARIFEQSL